MHATARTPIHYPCRASRAARYARFRQAVRRGTFRCVEDLTAAIGRFIDAYNQRCQPFTWTKDAGELIAKIRPSKN